MPKLTSFNRSAYASPTRLIKSPGKLGSLRQLVPRSGRLLSRSPSASVTSSSLPAFGLGHAGFRQLVGTLQPRAFAIATCLDPGTHSAPEYKIYVAPVFPSSRSMTTVDGSTTDPPQQSFVPWSILYCSSYTTSQHLQITNDLMPAHRSGP